MAGGVCVGVYDVGAQGTRMQMQCVSNASVTTNMDGTAVNSGARRGRARDERA